MLLSSGRYAVDKLPKRFSVHSEDVSVATWVLSVELMQQLLILHIQWSPCQPPPHPDFPMPLLPTPAYASSTLLGLLLPLQDPWQPWPCLSGALTTWPTTATALTRYNYNYNYNADSRAPEINWMLNQKNEVFILNTHNPHGPSMTRSN